MLRFGANEFESLEDRVRATRETTLRRLAAAGIVAHACGPPSRSGWLTVLGDVYFDTLYAPGEPVYERLRELFETEAGEALNPEVRFCLYWRDGEIAE